MRDFIALCWYVPWLREGCQDRFAGSVSTSLLLVAQHVSGKHVPFIRSRRLRDFISLCWLRRGCGKVVKNGWHLVRPLLFC